MGECTVVYNIGCFDSNILQYFGSLISQKRSRFWVSRGSSITILDRANHIQHMNRRSLLFDLFRVEFCITIASDSCWNASNVKGHFAPVERTDASSRITNPYCKAGKKRQTGPKQSSPKYCNAGSRIAGVRHLLQRPRFDDGIVSNQYLNTSFLKGCCEGRSIGRFIPSVMSVELAVSVLSFRKNICQNLIRHQHHYKRATTIRLTVLISTVVCVADTALNSVLYLPPKVRRSNPAHYARFVYKRSNSAVI